MTWGAVLLAAAMLMGCATAQHWEKAGGTQDDFMRDSRACAAGARQSLKVGALTDAGDPQRINKVEYRDCLEARGYRRTAEGTWIGLRD